MNGARTCILHALLGAALVAFWLPGVAAAVDPTPAPSPTPTPTPRYELGLDSGKVTTVGETPPAGADGNAIVKFAGSFVFDGPLDFASSSVTIRALLDEVGGAGELFASAHGPILPVELFRKSGNDKTVTFVSPASARPTFRLTLRRKPGDLYLASLKVNRAAVPTDPEQCTGSPETTLLDTVLVIDDGHDLPVTVAGSIAWLCALDNDKLRIPTGAETPPDQNQAPRASLRTNLLTRETGQPSQVLLDGSDSSDADGTIASYTFQVALKASGQVVFGPATGATSFVVTTLPPGDYTASLVVTDNLGKASTPATRGLSIK